MEEPSGIAELAEEFKPQYKCVEPFDVNEAFSPIPSAWPQQQWYHEWTAIFSNISGNECDSLATLGKHVLERLAYLAYKDQLAAKALISLAHNACVDIEELARLSPEMVKSHARRYRTFPAAAGRHSDDEKRVRELLEKLEAGEDSYALKQQRKRASGGRPAGPASTTIINSLAIALHQYIDLFRHSFLRDHYPPPFPAWWDECGKLTPFNCDTVKPWLKVAWKIVMESTNNEPENHPKLKSLGKHRERRGKSAKAKKKHIQNGIKEALHKAFLGIARPPP